MPNQTMKHLTNRARLALRNILEFPGAVEGITDAYLGGKLAASIDKSPLDAKKNETDAERVQRINAWFRESQPTEIDGAQIAVVKKALAAALATKQFGVSEELTEIITVLGLAT